MNDDDKRWSYLRNDHTAVLKKTFWLFSKEKFLFGASFPNDKVNAKLEILKRKKFRLSSSVENGHSTPNVQRVQKKKIKIKILEKKLVFSDLAADRFLSLILNCSKNKNSDSMEVALHRNSINDAIKSEKIGSNEIVTQFGRPARPINGAGAASERRRRGQPCRPSRPA
ncbi:hypothetical protein BpHYR1_043812 [Brachionus plicatilis]|uniref:Uncharacterized protein n=1 Tax=Brachionus plicatilis TaxID=10195 RepID=A0A3M7RWG3_BRAPC|nr:hypothetical protein BpHYR1_043812 [Brachionus plicatilis]